LNLSGPFTCYVMMQVKGGKFVRVFPEEKGKLDCPSDATFQVNLDPTKEFKG
jgi:hypothetical protein